MHLPRSLALLMTLAMALAACGSGSSNAAIDSDATSADNNTAETDPATTAAGSEAPEPDTGSLDGQEVAAVSIEGTPLPAAEGSGVLNSADQDRSIGSVVPTLTGTNFNGSEVTIGPDGRPKAVYFLAHWCPHCQDEVKLVKELVADGKLPAEIDLYAVTIAVRDDGANYPPSAWMADFPGTVMRDSAENEAATAAGVSGIPYVLYLDGENKLLSRSVGTLDEAAVLSQWDSLLPQAS